MKVETWLPIFPGFYNTIFEANEEDELYNINQERPEVSEDIVYDDCEWNNEDYEERVVTACCTAIETELQSLLGDKFSLKFQKIISPKYYNYTNDAVDIEVEVDMTVLRGLLVENIDEFDKYLKERYTSYDGFISSHSNCAGDWMTMFDGREKLGHNIGAILEFLLINEEYNLDDLYEGVAEECYITAMNYEELIK